ncbi:MAG: hypothetical protein JAY90_19555 [Candidatus Thiodiazotropha lotti]|nr:hypothetical protein [Candidatus Thiodiazotropha lotti]
MMKKQNGKRKNTESVSSADVNLALRGIGVKEGLVMPETPEEVEIFEASNVAESSSSESRSIPDLKQVLARARRAQESGEPLLKPNPTTYPDSDMAMAARNGAGLSEESLRMMDESTQENSDKPDRDGD